VKRPVEQLLKDIILAADVADEIIHAYHRLDYGRVWNTLSEDVPRLRAAVTGYRERGGGGG
jgi:uncharacterized protein with HEPN domain